MNSQLDHDSRYKEIRELFFTLPAEEQQNLIEFAKELKRQQDAEQEARA